MEAKIDNIAQKEKGRTTIFLEQHEAEQKLIDAQKDQIRIPNEKIESLENEKQRLADAGDQMVAALEKMDKVCHEQQKLLDSFKCVIMKP